MIHMAVVLGTIGFAIFTAYLLFTSSVFEPQATPPTGQEGGPVRKKPLPYWVRLFKSFSFLFTPLISYFIYYALPEPDEESDE